MKCSECGYTHSHEIGCRPAGSILHRNKSSHTEQENTRVIPGNMPSRESEMFQKPQSRTKEAEVRPEQPVPNAQIARKVNTPEGSSRENRILEGQQFLDKHRPSSLHRGEKHLPGPCVLKKANPRPIITPQNAIVGTSLRLPKK